MLEWHVYYIGFLSHLHLHLSPDSANCVILKTSTSPFPHPLDLFINPSAMALKFKMVHENIPEEHIITATLNDSLL
jgi:hypothetical protein